MLQQLIAIIVIVFFVSRIVWQRKKEKISSQEFKFWLVFWLMAGLAVLSLKKIDQLVANFGFTGSGIQVLLELSVAVLFYFIFRLRLRLAKLEKDITKIVETLAINRE